MTNKRVKGKKKINPLARQTMRVPRPRLSFDGQVLDSTNYIGANGTLINVAKDFHYVNGHAVTGIARNVAPMVNLYNEYKFRSVTVEWIPSISPASVDAGSRVHVAYIDNPEKMLQFETATALNAIAMVRSVKNCKSFNAWERFTYTVPLTYRRKLFDVDANDTPDINDLDRTTQGQIQVSLESVSAQVGLGTYRISYKMELHGLAFQQLT